MDTFYQLSKVFWFFASPDNFLIFLVVLGTLLVGYGSRWGLRILITSMTLMLVITFLPVADVLLRPLEKRFAAPVSLPENIQGVIVLGGAERSSLGLVWQQAQFNQAAERMMALAYLANQYPQAQIVFSGGSGSLLHQREIAYAATERWFVEQGLEERVIWEQRSRNTYENAVLSEQKLNAVPRGRWLLVTSAFHMPRSMGVFRERGWQVVAYPVDYNSITSNGLRIDPSYWRHVRDLSFTIKEWIGLGVYYYTGKTGSLFPAPLANKSID